MSEAITNGGNDEVACMFSKGEIKGFIVNLEEVKAFLATISGTSHLATNVLPITTDRLRSVLDVFYVADQDIEETIKEEQERKT